MKLPILSYSIRQSLIVVILSFISVTAIGQTETFSSGSFIINMGATNPNTIANGLKPYGLMYDLIRNYNVPIKWVINQTKVKDGIDFTFNGIQYKGGTFIIPAEYRSAAVNGRITYWTGLGVVGTTTASALTLDVAVTIVSCPKWTLDATNGAIAEQFLINAGITNTAFPGAYNWKSPAALDCCDDYFVMPHADPTWATHGHLWAWNKDCLGSVWAGCHAVSVLESLVNPSDATQKMNFLSTTGLLLFGSHSGGSVPYTHQLPSDPVAQYLGPTDLAQLNGSEQIYMPNAGGAWRPTTKIIAYDPTQTNVPGSSPGPASLIVYGRGLGDPTRGYVMYEASHNINNGSANSVAAMRAFFNFSFFQTTPKAPHLTVVGITAGQQINGGATITGLNVVATSPLAGITFTYLWSSSCGGSFSAPTATTTNYTAPVVGVNTSCIITCKVTDNCGRVSFNSYPIIINPPPVAPVAVPDSKQVDNSCLSSVPALTFNVLSNDYDTQGAAISFTSLNQASASPANAGVWTSSPDGTVVFTPDPNFSGTATIQYTMQNAGGITATTTITAIIGQADAHGCTPSNVWGVANTDFITNTSIVAVGNAAGITGELTTDPSMDAQEGTFTTAATDFIDMGTTVGTNYIDLQLPVTLNINDTVVIHWGKRTNNGTTAIGVRQSATSVFSGATTNYSVTGTGNLPSDTRYPIIANGMNYIRLQVGTGTTQNLYIDAVEYEVWSCVTRVPNINNDAVVALEDVTSIINVLNNDSDPAGGTLTVSGIAVAPAHGKVSVNLDNTITYVPNPDYKLTDYFIYRACTSDGYCDTARVTITISPDACVAGSYSPIPPAGATTASFIAGRDNYMKQNSANGVQGGTTLSVGFTSPNLNRAVLYFDLSTIPVGSIVTSATFQAFRSAGNSNTQFFTNHKLNTGLFVENQVTWNSWSTGNAWPVAGGGNFSAREDSVSITSVKKYYSWNAGNMVQSWVNTPATNYGMLLKGAGVLNKNHTFSDRTIAGKQPKLTVTYIVPAACTAIPANRAPLANPDTVLTNRATPITISPLANDDDINGVGTISLAAVTPVISATGGSYVVSGNNITYTPTIPGSPGIGTITYRVQDAGGLYDTSIIYIRIANAPPIAANDYPGAALSGLAQTFNVGTNDSDPEGAALTYRIYQDGKNGSSSIAGSNVTYTPNAGFTGKDTVYYEVSEPVVGCSAGLKDSAFVVFIVTNRAPTAGNDNKTVLPCLASTINLISNDTDPENGVLAVNFISPLSNPAAGTLVNNNDGTVTFTPATGFLGTVTFTYTVGDNGVPSLTSGGVTTVTINVTNPVNTPPVAGNDNESAPMDQVIYASVLDNDSDPENQNLTNPVITVAPAHGSAVVLANGLIKYTPNPGFFGADVLTYQVCDMVINPATCTQAPALCTTATLSITVTVPNTVVALNDENSTWINTPVSGGVMSNDYDPEGDTKLFSGFISGGSSVASGSITVSGVDAVGSPVANAGTLAINSNGTYTFTPANNFLGIVTVPYSIADNNINAAYDTAYLKITVSPLSAISNSVIANNDENTSYGLPVSGNVLVNDKDPQGDAFSITSFKYDTNGDGTADGTGVVGTPVTVGGITTTGRPTSNAGSLTLNANGSYTFTPAADFHGSIDVPYTICDNGSPVACATAILHIDVLPDINGPANDPPIAGDDFNYTNINTPVSGSFVNNDSDPNTNPISLNGTTINTGGAHTPIGGTVATSRGGTVQYYADGTYTYTPPVNYTGPDSAVYTICDVTAVAPQPLCTQALLHLLVGVNNTTDAINDENSTWQAQPVGGNVLVNDFDKENNTQSFGTFLNQSTLATIASGSTISGTNKAGGPVANAGTISFDASGNYTYSPDPAFTGTVSIPYRLCDNGNSSKCDTAYLIITIDPLPTTGINTVIANNDENISYGAAVSNNLFVNDRDPQNDAFTVTTITGGTVGTPFTVAGIDQNGNAVANAGTLVVNSNGTYIYTPAASFVGSINVPYIITDTPGATSTAVLNIDVVRDPNGPANDPPFAGDDFGYTTINQPVTGNFTGNDSDPNSNPLSVNGTTINTGGPHTPIGAPVSTAMGGSVQFYADGTYTYSPPAGYIGPDKVNYTTCDVTAVAPQPLCADAQIHLLIGPGINISGKVWDDANGNVLINGAESGTNVSSSLYVNLVNASGNVVAVATVLADGTYNFSNVTPGANYSLVLSTTQGTVGNPAPAASLPSNWVNTGESRNGTIDGGLLGVVDQRNFGFTNTVNFDFGIEQLPNSTTVLQNIAQPVVGQYITLNGGANPPVPVGTDAEDGALGATNSLVITTLPSNTTLWYNGIAVGNGQIIANFNPSLLQVQITAATLGSISTVFQFAYRDAAGKQDPTPASYTIQWPTPLPIILASFTGKANNCDAILIWKTDQEINVDRFEIEQSSDGLNFAKVAEVKAANSANGKTYQLTVAQSTAIMYYRLKMLDKDGHAIYSSVVTIRTSCNGKDYMTVYPNPAHSSVTISFHTAFRGTAYIVLQNAIGQQMASKKVSILSAVNAVSFDVDRFAAGTYFLKIVDEKGERIGEMMRVVKE